MSPPLEVRTRQGWVALRPGGVVPAVGESTQVEIRGAPAGGLLQMGPVDILVPRDGTVALRPVEDERLTGHVGLVPVAVDGVAVGELEIVPDKMSAEAFDRLRAELQRVWTDLVFDPDGVAARRAAPATARDLLHRIEGPLRKIRQQPRERLVAGRAVRRIERVRSARELSSNVMRAGARGRPALARVVERSTVTPENQMVAATLQLLRNHARRDPDGAGVVRRVEDLLRDPLFAGPPGSVRQVTWGMRSDPRYRQVLAVHQVLHRPELSATEGPGELRLGVAALPRLYEYWVFLQVLLAARAQYGPPTDAGFEGLAVRLRGGRRRLTLPRGTTVSFPGPVHVAFEPEITARGDGWMGLEYVPHPDRQRQQLRASPDVVVLAGGAAPSAIVIDAKYVGRAWVELEAARVHDKYARMRWHGEPVVRNVLVAHPHTGLAWQWSGYGHLPFVPGGAPPELPLPRAGSG